MPVTPVVPLTHSPAEPAESAPRTTRDEPGAIISYVALPGCPHPFYRSLRHWTPAFVPSLEGAFTLALALLLIFRGTPLSANLTGFGGIFTLFAIYLVGGALFGLTLYFAASDASWFAILVIGGLLLPALIFAPLLGRALGVAGIVLALALAILFLGSRRTPVREGDVAVTKLFGRYFRVVRLGHFLRLPGERVAAALSTDERVFTTPPVFVEIDSPSGVVYRARATCTATYAILPAEADRVVPVLATWENDLHAHLVRALNEALTDWATHAAVTGLAPPQGLLARGVMGDVRQSAQVRGIWLMRVRVHNIWLEPLAGGSWMPAGSPSASVALTPSGSSYPHSYPGSTPPGSDPQHAYPGYPYSGSVGQQSHPAAPRDRSLSGGPSPHGVLGVFGAASDAAGGIWPSVGAARHSDWRDARLAPMTPEAAGSRENRSEVLGAVQGARQDAPLSAPVAADRLSAGHTNLASDGNAPTSLAMGSVGPTPASGSTPASTPAGGADSVPLPAEALASAYEAVREGRITDPTTIRQIAQGFADAAEHSTAEPLPYDAAAAARILAEYAAKIEQHIAISVGSGSA